MNYISLKFSVLLCLFFSSCLRPSLYFPDRVVVTNFEKKNNLIANISVKPQLNSLDSGAKPGSPISFSGNVAYSFTDHFGAYLHYSHLWNRTVRESSYFPGLKSSSLTGGNFKGSRFEIGAVNFTNILKNQVVEIAYGACVGETNRTSILSDSNNFQAKYYTFFLQPSWSIKGDGFVFSVGSKVWFQRYNYFNSSYYVQTLFTDGQTDLITRNYIGLQPYFDCEAGGKYIRFNFQCSAPGLFRKKNYGYPLGAIPLHMSVGVCFQIDKNMFADFKSKKKNK
jgi:hypothetical protein